MTDLIKYSGDEFEKNSDRKDNMNYVSDLTRKYILQLFPGGGIVEDLLNYEAEQKTKRTVDFVDDLIKKILAEYGDDFTLEDLKNESFSDILNRVLQNIQNTTSDFKKNRFRDILLLKFKTKSEDLMFVKFVDLLDKVNEIQIVLLKEMAQNEDFLYGVGAHKGTEIIEAFIKKYGEKAKKGNFDKTLKAYTSQEKKSELEFYMLELASFGLIKPIPKKNQLGSQGSSHYIATEIGIKFLSFIIKE